MKKTRYHRCTDDTLQDLINHADRVIHDNPEMTYKDFSVEYDSEWDSYYVQMYYNTEETDKERVQREAEATRYAKQREEYERKQFEALQKKYGG
jgi:hypothetical protein